MLIKHLPNGLKELAEKRSKEFCTNVIADPSINQAFIWDYTMERNEFWNSVNSGIFTPYHRSYPNHEWTLDYPDEYYIDLDNNLFYKEDWLKMEQEMFDNLTFSSVDIARGYYAGIPTEPEVIEGFAKGFDVANNNKGIKEITNKTDYSEINFSILDLMAERFAANKHKYPKGNMKKELNVKELEWALFRHVLKIVAPREDDIESREDHLAAALCNISMILDQKKIVI